MTRTETKFHEIFTISLALNINISAIHSQSEKIKSEYVQLMFRLFIAEFQQEIG